MLGNTSFVICVKGRVAILLKGTLGRFGPHRRLEGVITHGRGHGRVYFTTSVGYARTLNVNNVVVIGLLPYLFTLHNREGSLLLCVNGLHFIVHVYFFRHFGLLFVHFDLATCGVMLLVRV